MVECSTIDRAMVAATMSKTASLSGMPDCRTSSPYTTDAKPLGPNHAAVSRSRAGSRVHSSDSNSAAGRTKGSR